MEDLSTRARSIAHMADVMRDFMASAVLFQDAVARTGGLNSTDLQTVGLLMSQGPATPGELAERTGLSAGGAITAVIDRLEKAGYVSRQRDQADRRRVIVTADADKVMREVGPIYGRVGARWAAYLDTLTDEQIELANELFSRAGEINRDEIEQLKGQR
ncbi:MarR family winged helix-turn-helix transcriptional regulator [Cellulomonas xylanilytica]|uniref:Putative HTH-type transcriptional regulator YcgE n=1 Tax=Cellulomonas xylanilytica TaxID=233583 RepID=A0A510V4R7_9CELL|nr:MarR family transcriptional regulator [Cellulomonas xylanilytica]GEK21868.1 putative HTH-type transcriptional regulator YcgE [Cellulomonas xylanilytica]